MAIQFMSVKPHIDLTNLPKVTETYEIQWTIPEWREVRKRAISVKNQRIIFETGVGSSFPYACQSKWAVGFKHSSSTDRATVQWNVLEFKKKSAELLYFASATTQLLKNTGVPMYTYVINENCIQVGQEFCESKNFVDIDSYYGCEEGAEYIQEDGSIKYELKLILKSCLTDKDYVDYKMKHFLKKSIKKMCENLTSLLNQRDVNSDLKIFTRDGTEIFVHGAILKAQCPVFSGMLACDLSETNTGVVKVNDVSGCTMNILLNYFYTGELLPAWREEENIVEFTYAAGKYQITQVLELLEDVLGRSVPDGEATHVDVQLLNLASKLSMPNAEQRLLKRIVEKINKAKESQDIFDLFGYDEDAVLEMAELLGGEMFGETKALEILDDLIGNTEGHKEELEKRGLHLLAVVQVKNGSMKHLEKSLLKRFGKEASNMSSADQLFAVFGHGKRSK